jgi:hypothetical protein
MNHRVELGENVVPVFLQEWGSEEGVPEEVFQFLASGHWCRIYATGFHSVLLLGSHSIAARSSDGPHWYRRQFRAALF